MTERSVRHRCSRWFAAGLFLLLAVPACSGDGDESSADTAARHRPADEDASTSSPPGGRSGGASIESAVGGAGGAGDQAAQEEAEEGAAEATATDAAGVAGGAPRPGGGNAQAVPAEGAISLGRSVIQVAHLEVEVADVAAASRQAQQVVAGVGGLLFGQDTTTEPTPRTSLTFKVPPERFAEALDGLQGLGRLQTQRVTADDVTDTVVDLQSRILTAEASVARLRALLERAEAVEQIAALEAQLLVRETDLERLRGQLRTLEDQVDLATIHLTLLRQADEPALEAHVTAYVEGDPSDDPRCPGEDELTVDEGDDLVVCVAITNTGSTPLARIEVRDPGLGLAVEDFRAVDVALGEVLAPGDHRSAWARVPADPSDPVAVRVTAVPVADDGTPLPGAAASAVANAALTVRADDSLPGFTDAVAAGWRALTRVTGLVVVAVGAAVPFLWVVPVAFALHRWRSRRRPAPAAPPPPGTTMAATE